VVASDHASKPTAIASVTTFRAGSIRTTAFASFATAHTAPAPAATALGASHARRPNEPVA